MSATFKAKPGRRRDCARWPGRQRPSSWVLAFFEREHFDRLRFRINQPIFLHAVLFVKTALFDAVTLA